MLQQIIKTRKKKKNDCNTSKIKLLLQSFLQSDQFSMPACTATMHAGYFYIYKRDYRNGNTSCHTKKVPQSAKDGWKNSPKWVVL